MAANPKTRASIKAHIERAQLELSAMQKGHCCTTFGSHDVILEILEMAFTDKSGDIEMRILDPIISPKQNNQAITHPNRRLSELINIRIDSKKAPSRPVIVARLYLILSVILGARSVTALHERNYAEALDLHTKAGIFFGEYIGAMGAEYSSSSVSTIAAMGAKAKLANDQKQADKADVKQCWELWQADPARYRGPTAFARDMLTKYENLESEEVIRRWCREWKAATQQA